VTIRPATESDLAEVHDLYREFLAEVPPLEYDAVDLEQELGEVTEIVLGAGIALVADDGGALQGFTLGRLRGGRVGFLSDLYVRPPARRRGLAAELVKELATRLADQGAEMLELDVQPSNAGARAVYERWGFATKQLTLVAPVSELAARTRSDDKQQSVGSTHVQSDDETSVERAVRQFLPRLGGSARSRVTPPQDGWITVYDDLCDRDRAAHRRFGGELSDRLGVPAVALRLEEGAVVRYYLFERGRMVDEYLSVPAYFGEVSKADEISLAANPTLVARLTGADPALVRATVRTAPSTADLPAGPELLAQVAAVLGVETTIER
jgi:ribosomal protein S18 acetylase RimI-like enzyme